MNFESFMIDLFHFWVNKNFQTIRNLIKYVYYPFVAASSGFASWMHVHPVMFVIK